MRQNKYKTLFLFVFMTMFMLFACDFEDTNSSGSDSDPENPTLNIYLSGSMASIEPIIRASGVPVNITYRGGVELVQALESLNTDNPAVHVFGVDGQYLAQQSSNFRDPYTFAKSYTTILVDEDLSNQMGWTLGENIHTADLLSAMEDGLVSLAVTNASQDDTGLNFYLSLLKHAAGTGDPLLLEDLQNPSVIATADIYSSAIVNTSGNIDLLVREEMNLRASGQIGSNLIVMPENSAIAFNLALIEIGQDPMQVFYVVDAVNMQTYIFGSARGLNDNLTTQYDRLVEYLDSSSVQEQILSLGYRATEVGMKLIDPDHSVFNPDWGVRATEEFVLAGLPKPAVIAQAQYDWQTLYKPPSFTAYCPDHSGSMKDDRIAELRTAMSLVLLEENSSKYLLAAGPDDTNVIMPFSKHVEAVYSFEGNDSFGLSDLYYAMVNNHPAAGGTAIYECAWEAIAYIQSNARTDQLTSVILLTDGDNTEGWKLNRFIDEYQDAGHTIPIYIITIGGANDAQMQKLAEATNGDVCDGRGSSAQLAHCFLKFRGNN